MQQEYQKPEGTIATDCVDNWKTKRLQMEQGSTGDISMTLESCDYDDFDSKSEELEKRQELENPIFNNCILEEVFNYLTLEDIKSCSLVCRFWYPEARRQLIRNSTLMFDGQKLEYTPTHDEVLARRTLKNYLTTFKNFVPSTCSLGLGSRTDEHEKELDEFFNAFGLEIEHLIVSYPFNFNHIFKVDLLLRWLINNLSNLERLDLHNPPGNSRFYNEDINPSLALPSIKRVGLPTGVTRGFLKDLFRACPNIREIETSDPLEAADSTRTSTNILETIRDDASLARNLTGLKFNCLSPYDLEILSSLDFQFRILHLGILPKAFDHNLIETILSNQSPALEDLELTSPSKDVPVQVTLPNFPELKTLVISNMYGRKGYPFLPSFSPLKYEVQLPKLRTLIVRTIHEFSCWDSGPEEFLESFWLKDLFRSMFLVDGQVCETVRRLELPDLMNGNAKFSLAIRNHLKNMFPKLTSSI